MATETSTPRIPHNACVLVGDGRKALFLRNEGTELAPRLKVENVIVHENPATHEQGTDRPGRAFVGMSDRRSAVEQTDWHQLTESRFARDIAATLNAIALAEAETTFIIAAPARAMGDLRLHLHANVKQRLLAEVTKDFTGHPLAEIQRHLTKAVT